MLTKQEFRDKVIFKALCNIRFNALTMKLGKINLKDYYLKTSSIIMYQVGNEIHIECMDEERFSLFAKTHFDSWWVLREGEVTAISSLSLLADNNISKCYD